MRHNLGFLVVDEFAAGRKIAVNEKKYRSLVGSWPMGAEKVLLVKPQTYMNRSGESVKRLFRYLPVSVKDLIVIYDDLDLPFGRIRIRERGGAGGHRGVRSIMEALRDQEFLRVRIGIGRPSSKEDPTNYVLEPFSREQAPLLVGIVSRAAAAVEALLQQKPQRAMEEFNQGG